MGVFVVTWVDYDDFEVLAVYRNLPGAKGFTEHQLAEKMGDVEYTFRWQRMPSWEEVSRSNEIWCPVVEGQEHSGKFAVERFPLMLLP